MILPDVNVLIYAFRPDSGAFAVCRAWLERVLAGDARFAVSPLALAAVVRITTNARVYEQPSSLAEAFAFCNYVLAQPHCEIVEPRERHWQIFQRLALDGSITGSRLTDAWYAALAIEWGCELITFDRDFARFPELRCRGPALD